MMAGQSDTGRCTMLESRLSVGNVEILSITDIDVDFPIPIDLLKPFVSANGRVAAPDQGQEEQAGEQRAA
jgi:hypothetical protein